MLLFYFIMSAQNLKQLYLAQKYGDCINMAIQLLKKNSYDKQALFLLAQSQAKVGMLTEAQNNLNSFVSLLIPGQDDALFYNSYMTQDEIAIQLQQSTNKQQRAQGLEIQIRNKFSIIDFLEKKQKFEKMLEETEVYVVLLLSVERYQVIEDTYVWLMNHKQLSDQIRVQYGARIFDIDQFYNPYSRIDVLFPRLCKMAPQSESLQGMALKMMELLEKQPSKKSVGTCFQSSDNNVQHFKDFCDQIKQIGEIVFTSTEKIFSSKTNIKMFTRYIGAISVTTVFLSDDWVKFETRIQQLLQTQLCQSTLGDLEANPIQVFLMALLDVSTVIRQARIPNFEELMISKMPKLNECMDTFSRDFSEYSQYVNAYYAICATSTNCLFQFEPQTIKSKINQALFLARKTQHGKFYSQLDTSDFQIYLSCLTLKLNLPKEEFATNFTQVEIQFEKSKRDCSKLTVDFYQGITTDLKWQSSLLAGNWLQAIQGLEELAAQNADKLDFVTVKKAKIQVQNIDQICANEDKDIFLVGIMSSLKNCATTDAENLLIQGYLMWTYPTLYGSDSKVVFNKWLLALKKDQTNPEIYYALGVYYFTINDFKRAQGCLDKVLKLQPNFEQALVIAFYLVQEVDLRLSLVDKFMETNRNVAVTYFLRGLIMQQKQDFFQAIEMYQNAIKFYTIQNSKPKSQLLLPELTLSIHQNPFGIYGNANPSVCWVYQSECFLKIDKPQVALKCFVQALDEISKVKLNQVPEVTDDIKQLLQILDLESFVPVPVEVEGVIVPEPIVPLLQNLQPSKWALECLMLGSRLVQQPQLSITILNAALKCSPTQPMLAFILTELISRATVLVDQGISFENGQVKHLENTGEIIKSLQQLLDFVSVRDQFITCQNLQKKRLNAIFAIAQRTLSKDNFKQAMDTASLLVSQGVYYPSLILDYAKIVHEYQRYVDDESLQNLKISLIKKAILLDPSQANLWVHLHMFSADETTRAKAIFKAYDLDQENIFVQETILKYYLQTKQWKKAFKIIIKSYQRATNANEPQMPIVLATLAYFNSVCYFKYGQRQQLMEALSLIKMIEREDMKQLLSEVFVYLSFYNGDYENTLSYLKSLQRTPEIDLCILKASFGSNNYKYEQGEADAAQSAINQKLLQEVFQVQSLSNDELKQKTVQNILEFSVNSIEIAPFLALYQELCIQRKLILQDNILDIPNAQTLIQKLNQNLQRAILIQSLRLLQMRDGTIKEAKPIEAGDIDQLNKQPADSDKSYTQFIIEASRLKPQFLTAAQHRALLRLYLNSIKDPSTLQGLFNDQIMGVDKFKIQGLKLVIQQRKQLADQGAAQLEANPECIESNLNYLWYLLRQGKIQETIESYNQLKEKFPEVVSVNTQITNVINALTAQNVQTISQRMSLITSICMNLSGTDSAKEIDLNCIACLIVQNIKRVSDQSQLVDLMFSILKVTLFEQGHYLVYNKLVKIILEYAAVAQLKVVNQIWHYQLLNTASALIQLRKVTQLIPLCKEIDDVSNKGQIMRPLLPANLLRARAYLALNNHQQLQQSLNVDDSTLERDFLQALALYSAQDYKQYYLTCLGLVAGAKTAQVSSWNLAYAYYLKGFAEMTFLVAKRSGIKLKDDFTQLDGNYEADFFKAKALTTLTKCLTNLEGAGEQQGMLKQAVDIMIKQI